MKYKYALLFWLCLSIPTLSYGQDWQASFEEAKALAAKENKNILLVFSGSDWCAPCAKLDKTLWRSKEFKEEAQKHWVLYRADFPKTNVAKLSPKRLAANKDLALKYNTTGSFPKIMLLSKSGQVLGVTGFKNVSAKDYIQMLHSFEK